MLSEWRECRDDIVVAPEGMVTGDGKARRRTWRCETSPSRRYELTAYLGLDHDDFLVVVWECEVWVGVQRTDHMRTSCQYYGWKPARVAGGKFAREAAMRALSPLEVSSHAAWGGALPGWRS